MNKGDRVKVDFIGESATIYSGKRFTGYGVLDRVEDGRVFGRLDDGTPFMCLCADVEVVGMSDFEKYWNEHGDVYAMDVAENAWDYQQSKIDELRKENAALVHVIKSRDIQLENEKHEYDELESKLVDSKMKNTKLQKRVDALELTIKGAVTFVDLQIEATEHGREAAIGTQAKNWWSSKLLMLRPVRKVLEQSLKGVEE